MAAAGSGESRLDAMGSIEFDGAVGKKIAEYGQVTQRFGHDLAAELDEAAAQANKAIRKLKGHPLCAGIDVYFRARWCTRHLRRAAELARGVSAESVRFTLQYRREFLDIQDAGAKAVKANKKFPFAGEVDL
jgi:hypothetical protein